jgi:hypothetical protein
LYVEGSNGLGGKVPNVSHIVHFTASVRALFALSFLMFSVVSLQLIGAGGKASKLSEASNSRRQYIVSQQAGKVNTLGGHGIGYSKQKSVFVHVYYSQQFPRQSC